MNLLSFIPAKLLSDVLYRNDLDQCPKFKICNQSIAAADHCHIELAIQELVLKKDLK